jgi:hypothetical protein
MDDITIERPACARIGRAPHWELDAIVVGSGTARQ